MENHEKMAKQPGRTLYLSLALVCFLGIVLIFLFDGYLGVYDSLKADNGNFIQEVPVEQWQNPDRYGPSFSMGLDQTGYLDFTYKVDNRRFGGISEPVTVTVADLSGTTTELVNEQLTIGVFGRGEVNWQMNGSDFATGNITQDVLINLRLTIQRGAVTRDLTIYLNRTPTGLKVIPSTAG